MFYDQAPSNFAVNFAKFRSTATRGGDFAENVKKINKKTFFFEKNVKKIFFFIFLPKNDIFHGKCEKNFFSYFFHKFRGKSKKNQEKLQKKIN